MPKTSWINFCRKILKLSLSSYILVKCHAILGLINHIILGERHKQMKLLIVKSPPLLLFFPFGPKYSPQDPVLKYFKSTFMFHNHTAELAIITNSVAYGTRRFNAAFTRALQ